MPQVKFYQHKESILPMWARKRLEKQRREIDDLKNKNADLVKHVEKSLITEIQAIRDIHSHGRVLTQAERKTNRERTELINLFLKSFS